MNSRRRFLVQSMASVASVLCGSSLLLRSAQASSASVRQAGEYFLIGDGIRGKETLFGTTEYAPVPGRVRNWRFGQSHVQEIGLPFFPHSFTSAPQAPHRVVTFEKWGRQMAEIDLGTQAVIRITRAQPGRRFFGHGVHAGNLIYATQMDDVNGVGLVSVMDAATHQVVREFSTQGVFPHDCQWLPDSNTLLVVNSRSSHASGKVGSNSSSVVWLDADTGKCRKQVRIGTARFGYAHLARSSDGFLALSGSYDAPSGMSQPLLAVIRPDDSVQTLMPESTSLHGEALSLYLNEADKLVATTLPNSSLLQIWNYQTGQFVRQYELPEPRGLAYSAEHELLMVTSAPGSSLLALDRAGLAQAPRIIAAGLAGRGSHLVPLSF